MTAADSCVSKQKGIFLLFCTTHFCRSRTCQMQLMWISLNSDKDPFMHLFTTTENTHLLCKGKYHWTADLLFDRLGFGQTSKSVYSFNSTKQLNPNQSNRRSAVQWYFPLRSECSLATISHRDCSYTPTSISMLHIPTSLIDDASGWIQFWINIIINWRQTKRKKLIA